MGPCTSFRVAVGIAALSLVSALACSETSPIYGDPSGLQLSKLPGEGGAPALTCDGGAAGGKCPTWSGDIYPMVQTQWACTSASCHGGARQPLIAAQDAKAAYATLSAYQINGVAYVDPNASKDPAQSSIVCNLVAKCGTSGMPQPPGKVTCGEYAKLLAWVQCGSAND